MFDFELPKEVTRIWDLVVPIIQNESETYAYITDGIGDPSDYNELCYLLKAAPKGHTFHLHINTPGGVLDSAFMLVDALKSTSAHTVAHLTGTVASAGTIIALSCDELIVAEHTSFLIHNYSSSSGYEKAHELKARTEFTNRELNKAFKVFYSGFLTDTEIAEVIDGRDMWLSAEDVLARWSNKITYNKAISLK